MTLGPLMVDVPVSSSRPRTATCCATRSSARSSCSPATTPASSSSSALVADIHAVRTPPLIVAVDHEGGRVQRFRQGFTVLPPLRAIGTRIRPGCQRRAQLARSMGWLMAAELRAIGIDISFAPCVDLDYGVSESSAIAPSIATRGRRRARDRLHRRHEGGGHGGDRQTLSRARRRGRGLHKAMPVDRRHWPTWPRTSTVPAADRQRPARP